MRIFEIDGQDELWAKSAGVNLDVDKEYNNIVSIIQTSLLKGQLK